jgi:hypothetical protein
MGTSIVSPGMISSSVPGMAQIDNAFSNIYSMFGGQSTGGGGTVGNVFGQPITGGGGSGGFGIPMESSPQPDAEMTSVWNLLGQAAPSLLQQGTNLVSTGMGVTGGGLDMSGAGFGTTQEGLSTLDPALSYYQQLLGNPTAMATAAAPAAAALSPLYSNLMTQANQGVKGGYTAETTAEAPQAMAGQIGNALLALQPQAAAGIANIGGEQAQIGGEQAQIGQGVAGTGTNIAGTGTTLTSQGLQTLAQMVQEAIAKQGLNYQYGGPQTFATIMQGLGGVGGGYSSTPGGGSSGTISL